MHGLQQIKHQNCLAVWDILRDAGGAFFARHKYLGKVSPKFDNHAAAEQWAVAQ